MFVFVFAMIRASRKISYHPFIVLHLAKVIHTPKELLQDNLYICSIIFVFAVTGRKTLLLEIEFSGRKKRNFSPGLYNCQGPCYNNTCNPAGYARFNPPLVVKHDQVGTLEHLEWRRYG